MADNRLRDKVEALVGAHLEGPLWIDLEGPEWIDLEARIIALINEEKSLSYGIGYQDGQRKVAGRR